MQIRNLFIKLALCSLLTSATWAQDVELGGQVIFRVENPKQAQAITTRLENLMFNGANPAELKLVSLKTGISIYWGKLEIVKVTKTLAEANSSQPKALAALWLKRLREIAEVGLLKLNPAKLELPVDGEAIVEVSGLATGPFTAQDSNGRVQINEDNGQLRIKARAVGKSKVLITRGKAKAYLFVHVKDWAGKLPDTIQVQVSGHPAPGDTVLEAVLRALMTQAQVNPGCKLQVDVPNNYQSGLPSIAEGQQMNIALIGKITGSEDYFPVRKDIRSNVECIAMEPVEPNLLLVSNRPEQVDRDGILLNYTLTPKEPSRLMYSHMNASDRDRNLWVNLYNPGREEVSLLVDWSYSGPSRNEVTVGHAAAQRFLTRLGANAGYILKIPPNTRLELADHVLKRKDLLSGFATLRMLKGSSLEVQVLTKSVPGRNDGSKLEHLGAPFNPFKIHPHGVFAQPYFEEWLEFTTGSRPMGFNFGESPWLIDFETGLPNTGNFGVIYRWHIALSNPSNRTQRFALFFTPKNGAAALSMLINNDVISIPFTPRNQEMGVRSFTLEPGRELNLDLTTLPEASSSYPATLEIRQLQTGESGPVEYREQD